MDPQPHTTEGPATPVPSDLLRALGWSRTGFAPVDPAPDALVSPVDAKVYVVGRTEEGKLPQRLELAQWMCALALQATRN